MDHTTNYNLKKPGYNDFADIQDINDNMDTIDAAMVDFTGASSGAAGAKGFVPAPAAGDQNKYMRADGSWQTPVNNALATAAGGVLDARMGKTLQDQITSLNDALTPVQVSIAAGAYAAFDRYNCFRVGRIVWFSCAVTTSSALTSANDLASGLPASDNVVDAMATTAAGNSYAIYAFGGRLKPNSSMPAGTYFINLMYIASA